MSDHKTFDPNDGQNWTLECPRCGERFPKDAEMGMVEAHMDLAHDFNWGVDKFELNLKWIGLGPDPIAKAPDA